MIELENVTMTYPGGMTALKDVNINIEKGEFVFIVGSSGSGKTTLIKLLLKELDPTSGDIRVAGYNYRTIKKKNIPKVRRKIGVVFQNFRLLKDRTIYENIAFAQRVIQTPARYIRRRVPAMLTLVGLADKYKSYPKELSGGEQQRVALARALVNNPEIILADEPTGNLDPKNSQDIMDLLDDINKRGTTVVVVTHNKEIVNEMKKRVITLKKGVVISDEKQGGYIDED
jgi:cell division transport system ATP-binding protein